MMTLFSALGIDLPSIDLIVLHCFAWSVLWSTSPKLSPLLSFLIVCYSRDLLVHLSQGGRGRMNLRSSRVLISLLEPPLCWVGVVQMVCGVMLL